MALRGDSGREKKVEVRLQLDEYLDIGPDVNMHSLCEYALSRKSTEGSSPGSSQT